MRVFKLPLNEDATAEAVIRAGLVTPEATGDHAVVEAALAVLVRRLLA
jgi:hypothetical protein